MGTVGVSGVRVWMRASRARAGKGALECVRMFILLRSVMLSIRVTRESLAKDACKTYDAAKNWSAPSDRGPT